MATTKNRDARLAEFERMGMPRPWLRVAQAIGVDAFLTQWRILDEEFAHRSDKSVMEIPLRPFRSYLRYQRNRFIEALFAAGLDPAEIRKRVRAELCEDVSPRHISRICGGG